MGCTWPICNGRAVDGCGAWGGADSDARRAEDGGRSMGHGALARSALSLSPAESGEGEGGWSPSLF